ncbi:MAG: hypothetical protein K0R58_3433, partial [Ramlibacter sp.]|nr:hypothetical protein [Ramlibacter sp.]
MNYDVIVVGEGIAGLTCAGDAAKLGLKVATYEADFFGGLVVNINELQNFDEAHGMSGMDHAGVLAMGNKKAGVKSTTARVSSIRSVDEGFEVHTDAGQQLARFVVMASGARLKKLGVPGEADFEGRGVSHCADCDAPMFTGDEVVVAGGGDWAAQDAMVLSAECAAVHLVYEEDELAACPDYVARVQADPKIKLHPGAVVEEILGDASGMSGVRLRDRQG